MTWIVDTVWNPTIRIPESFEIVYQISNGWASGSQIPFQIWTICRLTSLQSLEIQTCSDFRSQLHCLMVSVHLNTGSEKIHLGHKKTIIWVSLKSNPTWPLFLTFSVHFYMCNLTFMAVVCRFQSSSVDVKHLDVATVCSTKDKLKMRKQKMC